MNRWRCFALFSVLALAPLACADETSDPTAPFESPQLSIAALSGVTTGPSQITAAGSYRWGVRVKGDLAYGLYYVEIRTTVGHYWRGWGIASNGALEVWGPYWEIAAGSPDFTVTTRIYNSGQVYLGATPAKYVDVAILYGNPYIGTLVTIPSTVQQYDPFSITLYGSDFDAATAEVLIYGPDGTNCCAYIRNSMLEVRHYNQLTDSSFQLSIPGTYEIRVRNVSTGVFSNPKTFVVNPR